MNAHDVLSHGSDAISRHYWAEQQSSWQCGAGLDGSIRRWLPTLVFHIPLTPQPHQLKLYMFMALQLVTGKQAQVGIKGECYSDIPPKEATRVSKFLTCLLAAFEKLRAAEATVMQRRWVGEEIISRGHIAKDHKCSCWNQSNLTAKLNMVTASGTSP